MMDCVWRSYFATCQQTESGCTPETAAVISSDLGRVIGIAGGSRTTLLAVIGVALLFITGILILYRRRSPNASTGLLRPQHGDDSSTDIDNNATVDTPDNLDTTESRRSNTTVDPEASAGGLSVTFENRIGRRTLDRLEPVVPDTTKQVRDRLPLETPATSDPVDTIERDLRRAIESALDAGQFDPAVTSSLGGTYNVVNLPVQFRELTVPPENETVHVADVETAVRETLEDSSLQATGRTVEAVHNHCNKIESYVRRREESYLDERREVGDMLADVQQMTDRFDGTLGDRVREFVHDGRDDTLAGVVDIERQLDTADQSLHACTFDDADRTIDEARRASDDLLVAIDFLSGTTGTIEHGTGRVAIPDELDNSFVTDLVPVLDRQYTATVELDGNQLVVTGGSARSGDTNPSKSRTGTTLSGPEASTGSTTSSSTGRRDRGDNTGEEQLTPSAAADEILYILRELDGREDSHVVECQTGQLPDMVARREVLNPLAMFCRRQTEIVASVTLQENAPPGFFEIQFIEETSASAGLELLRERFIQRHGG